MFASRYALKGYNQITIRDRKNQKGENTLVLKDEDGQEIEFRPNLDLDPVQVENALAETTIVSQPWVQRSTKAYNVFNQYDPIRELGSLLFNQIFDGQRKHFYQQARYQAREQERGLRLEFQLENERWTSLPWEFMHDQEGFITLSSFVQVSRRVPRPSPSRPLHLEPKHKPQIGLMLEDKSAEQFSYELVKFLNEDYLKPPNSPVNVQIFPLYHATELLASGQTFDVLHFIGSVNPAYLEKRTANNEPSGELRKVAWLLMELKQPTPLVFFQVAYSQQLARQVAPMTGAVLGLNGILSVKAAQIFAQALYRSLLNNETLDQAVATARQEIDLQSPGSREWGLPQYYRQQTITLLAKEDETAFEATELAAPASRDFIPKGIHDLTEIDILRQMEQLNLAELKRRKDVLGDITIEPLEKEIKQAEENLESLSQDLDTFS